MHYENFGKLPSPELLRVSINELLNGVDVESGQHLVNHTPFNDESNNYSNHEVILIEDDDEEHLFSPQVFQIIQNFPNLFGYVPISQAGYADYAAALSVGLKKFAFSQYLRCSIVENIVYQLLVTKPFSLVDYSISDDYQNPGSNFNINDLNLLTIIMTTLNNGGLAEG